MEKKLWGCPLNGLCITFNAPKSWSLSPSSLFVYRQNSFSLSPPVLDRSRVRHVYLLFNSLTRRGEKKSLFLFIWTRSCMSLLALIQDREPKQEIWGTVSSFSIVKYLCHGQNLAFVIVKLSWVKWSRYCKGNPCTVASTISELMLYVYIHFYLQLQHDLHIYFYISHTWMLSIDNIWVTIII